MAIETICKGCARKLRVGDDCAGRKARCPHCRTIYTVPEFTSPESASDSEVSPEPFAETNDKWLLRTGDGTVYGPVSKADLDSWVRDGRLDVASQVRRKDATTWRSAADLYPTLLLQAASSANPFSSEPTFSDEAANPYVSPRAGAGTTTARYYRPHRGGVVLTLSLLGFACCQLLSIAAWVMGHADMKEIDAGRMDPAGRGLTQAGMIIGIVGTILIIITVVIQLLMVLFALTSQM